MSKNMINETRLFSNVVKNMGSPDVLVEELVENARRSKSSKVVFQRDENILTVTNDGDVLDNFDKLLVLADSEYDEDICRTENPAGMGIYLILSSTASATFKSGYKTLTVDSQRLFNDSKYRENILDSIVEDKSQKYVDGFISVLDLGENTKKILTGYVDLENNNCCTGYSDKMERLKYYFDIDIIINGHTVETKNIDFLVEKEGTGILSGARIGIPRSPKSSYSSSEGTVYWHGKRIDVEELFPFSIIVSDNHTFKPKLPDRRELVNGKEELLEITKEIELQLSKDIQAFLDAPLYIDGKFSEDSNVKEYLLHGLKSSYNTDKVMRWSGVYYENIKDRDYVFHDGIEDSCLAHINCVDGVEDISSEDSSWMNYMDEILEEEDIYNLSSRYAKGSKAPLWARSKMIDKKKARVVFHLSQKDLDNCADIYPFQKCKKIELEFEENVPSKSLSAFIDESAGDIRVVDYSLHIFEDYFVAMEENEGSSTYDSAWDYLDGCMKELESVYAESADIVALMAYLSKLSKANGISEDIVEFTYSNEKITGVTAKGESFEYGAITKRT